MLTEEQILQKLKEAEGELQGNQSSDDNSGKQQQDASGNQGKKDDETAILEQMKRLADAVNRRIEALEKGAEDQTKFESQEEPKSGEDEQLFKMLEAMTPEQRTQWAAQTGAEGVAKLLEFNERQLAKRIEDVEKKAASVPVEVIAQEWRSKREEWLKNDEVAAFAEGIDLMLLRKKGVSSYKEMSASELRQHLKELDEKVEAFVKKIGLEGGKKGGKEDDEKDDEKKGDELVSLFRSVGDAAGAAAGSGDEVDVTKLRGFELEQLSLDQLKKLEKQLLM